MKDGRMLLSNLNLLATAPGGVARLRELILTLAVQGKLVPQDAADEPASVLLERIGAEKERLIAEGQIKRGKPLAEISAEEKPFKLPVRWEWARLGTIAKKITDGTHHSPANFPSGDYMYLSAKNIKPWGIDLSSATFVPRAVHEEIYARCDPELGDILYIKDGATTGILTVNTISEPFSLLSSVGVIKPSCGLISAYMALVMQSPFFYQAMREGMSGVAITRVTLSKLGDAKFPLPPLAEQSRIVTRVEELMQLCDALEAKGRLEAAQHARLVSTLLATLAGSASPAALAGNWERVSSHFDLLLDRPEAVDALEQAILQLAVRGLLVPQNPQDEPASVLLARIRAEKDRLIAERKIKRDKPLAAIAEEERPFGLPSGWEWVRLGAASKKITDGTHHSPANFPSGDFMYLSAKNIKSWGIDLSSATFVPKAVHDEIFARCDPEFGDILYIKDGATTGVLTINTIRDPVSLLSSVGVIKPSCGLTSDYMALVMQSPFFYQAMRDGMTGVAITRVTLSKLADAKFPLPPFLEQSRIVARVASLRHLCADLRQRLAARQTTQAQLAEALVETAGA